MKNIYSKFILLLIPFTLVSCSQSHLISQHAAAGVQQAPVGPTDSKRDDIVATTGIEQMLDKHDKETMSHALDKPLGKATAWHNANTGASYVVTPIEKKTLNGNPFCRKYSISVSQNGSHQESTDTACVSPTDSSWQMVN